MTLLAPETSGAGSLDGIYRRHLLTLARLAERLAHSGAGEFHRATELLVGEALATLQAAGEAAAYEARRLGASVAVVDRELFGGSCPFWACMPSKALLHAAAVVGGADFRLGALKVVLDYRDFRLATVADGLYDSAGTRIVLNRAASSRHVGHGPDAHVVWAAGEYGDITLGGRYEPVDGPNQRGLARTGEAHHDHHLAVGDLEREVLQRMDTAGIGDGCIFETNHAQ